MPGVICYRTPSQDCVLLGHLYRSSYDKTGYGSGLQEASSSTVQSTGYYTKLKPNCRLCSLAQPRLTLLSVSPEIVLSILAELAGPEILNCRNVCKTLKRLIDQSVKLQYIIQANVRGLEPLVANMLFRERSWTMFGSIPSACFSLQRPPDLVNDLAPKRYSTYHSGKLVLCCGNQTIEHALHPRAASDPQEYEVPQLEVDGLRPVAATRDVLVYSTESTIHIYSKANNEIVSVLTAPHLDSLGIPSVRGNWIAALFRSERRCSGVLIWDWKSGKLIDTIYDAYSPALSVTFFDEATLGVVHTDRNACSARVDTYKLDIEGIALRSSVSLPDAHPSKWYAKADIYTGDESSPPGSERMMPNEGIVAINLEMRIRAPHNPETITADRRLSVILVVHKRIFSPDQGTPVTRIPWTHWSANNFRILSGVRLSPQRPVWGYRLVAVGPEPDKLSLFDFCPIGARQVAQVWKGNGTWGVSSSGRGGVSVRAALAQRARTLVRASTLGAVVGWFDNLKPSVDQIPYVVSVRRGVVDVVDTMLDGGNVVVTLEDGNLAEQSTSTRVILFNFVP
ncbi:unnamed protein product [Rhizoctonia solani]|uniref:F-box domain-containing protein n=1 Tax=Rhizoctonia solani TaxID=456999 RepID=A0A8H3GT57_9AGAM|nr:unnamed protein product [Rhizoctonia solani]